MQLTMMQTVSVPGHERVRVIGFKEGGLVTVGWTSELGDYFTLDVPREQVTLKQEATIIWTTNK